MGEHADSKGSGAEAKGDVNCEASMSEDERDLGGEPEGGGLDAKEVAPGAEFLVFGFGTAACDGGEDVAEGEEGLLSC